MAAGRREHARAQRHRRAAQRPPCLARSVRIARSWHSFPTVLTSAFSLAPPGFMSNRGRQNVASFLTQNMNVDWRLGAAYFEERLIDHDVCSNYANWLLAAGVIEGRRANVFDILRQSAAYDAEVRAQVPLFSCWHARLRAVCVNVAKGDAVRAVLRRGTTCATGFQSCAACRRSTCTAPGRCRWTCSGSAAASWARTFRSRSARGSRGPGLRR